MNLSKTLAAATLLTSLAASILAMSYVDSHDRLDMAIADIERADRALQQAVHQLQPKGSERPIGQ